MKPACLLVFATVAVGCGSHQSPVSTRTTGMNMPNPNGCYIKVFDREQFHGTADFISGPHRYATLTDLPNAAKWANRIRSAEVGPGAIVMAWTEEDFKGRSLTLGTERRYGGLTETFAGHIASMEVSCTPAPKG